MAELSKSLANFYATRAQREREARYYEELQKEQKIAAAEQAAAQAAAEEEKNKGGFFGGLGYTFEKIGLGFLSGLEGIWDYTAGGLAKLFGADDWAEQQFANDWVNYNHADEWFNPSEGWKVAGDVAGGIGTSLPAIAGVAAAGAIAYFSGGTLSGVSAGIISGVIAGLGAAGNATKEAYRETGELGGKEFGYGFLVGLTEGTIEGVSGAIGAGTGAVVKNMTKSFGKQVADTAVRQTLGKTIIKSFVGEAFEEGVAEFLDPYWKRITYDPDAKNASFQEIAYASLVGGLSGALMGGFDASVRNIHSTAKGKSIVESGRTADVIGTAENLSAYQTENQTEYESVQLVNNVLTELKTSLESTNGEVKTWKQQMLLGVLEKANTSAAFEDFATASAINIFNNAEAVAERLNAYGYTDANGNKITVTAEQLRAGIDTTNSKTMRKSMSKALKTNGALRSLAIIDATGRLTLNTAQFADATLRGQQLSSQADLNRFIETASESEMQAVAEKLGIEDWNTLTNEIFQERIAKFVADGGVENYRQEHALVQEAKIVDPATAKGTIPRMVNLRQDGSYRYTQGDIDIAIIKRGDSYRIFDYDNGRMSKSMTRTEINKALREMHTSTESYAEAQRQFTERENARKQQAIELDNFARTNIKGYENLSAANQSIIRSTIRQGRAAGLSDDFILTCARISTRSGLRIVFSKEMSFVAADGTYADGAIDLKHNRIIINPEAKNRTSEQILIHELTHAIYSDADGVITVAEGVGIMSSEEKNKIRRRYARVGRGGAVEVADEINAHFAEQTLSNKNILERLAAKKPTVKEKILSFFKKAKTDYQGDTKLTGAAARLFKQYQKLFDSFAQQNYQRNAAENLQGDAATSYALQTAMRMLGGYDETRKRHIESGENDTIAQGYADVVEFIKTAKKGNPVKRIHIGIINDATAALVKKKTGVDIKDYDFVLASNFIAHIFDSHGSVAKETPRGQTPVNHNNIENIIETVINPDDISVADDGNGKALRFEKQIEGRNIAITILSTKKSTLTLKSAWIINNNSGGRTPSASETTLAGTSETNGRNSTTDSISENGKKVNKNSNKDERFVISDTDSDGNKLTAEQREYFKDSKIVDEKGNLIPMYHGTASEFNIFEMSETGASNNHTSHVGFWFTPLKEVAEHFAEFNSNEYYGKKASVKEVYLNLKNPKIYEPIDNTKAIEDLQTKNETLKQENAKRYKELKETVGSYNYMFYFDDSYNPFSRDSHDIGFRVGEDYYIDYLKLSKEAAKKAKTLVDEIIATKKSIQNNTTQLRYLEDNDSFMQMSDDLDEFMEWINPSHNYERGYGRENFVSTNAREAAEKFRQKLIKQGYDGIWIKNTEMDGSTDQIVAFESKQVKLTSNKNPTESSDIRFALGRGNGYDGYSMSNNAREAYDNGEMPKSKWTKYAILDAVESYDSSKVELIENLSASILKDRLLKYSSWHHTSAKYNVTDFYEIDTDVIDELTKETVDTWTKDYKEDLAKKKAEKSKKKLFLSENGKYITAEATFAVWEGTRAHPKRKEYTEIVRFEDGAKMVQTSAGGNKRLSSLSLSYQMRTDKPVTDEQFNEYKQQKIEEWRKQREANGYRYALSVDNGGKTRYNKKGKQRKTNYISYDKLGTPTVSYLRNELRNIYADVDNGIADRIAIEKGNTIYVVDSGIENGEISFGIIYKVNISDEKARKDFIERTNYESIQKGYVSDGLSSRLRVKYGNDRTSNRRQQVGEELSTDNGQSSNNEGRVSDGDGVRGLRGLTDSNRFALSEDNPRTSGETAKFKANYTRKKVYSRIETEEVIDDIIEQRLTFDDKNLYGTVKGEKKVVDYLFKKFNTTETEAEKYEVALNISDYIIENTVLHEMVDDEVSSAMQVLSIARGYMHSIDLSGIRSEVQNKYGKKTNIFAIWGATKDSAKYGPDELYNLLAKQGLVLKEDTNGADMFFEMLEVYNNAKSIVDESVQQKKLDFLGDDLESLRGKIAKDVIKAYENKGTKFFRRIRIRFYYSSFKVFYVRLNCVFVL